MTSSGFQTILEKIAYSRCDYFSLGCVFGNLDRNSEHSSAQRNSHLGVGKTAEC